MTTRILRKHASAQADHVDEPRADRGVGMKQRLRSVLHDDVGEKQAAPQDGQDNRLIDQEIGEGDVAEDRRGEHDQGQDPAKRARGRPGVSLRRGGSRAGDWRREPSKQAGDDERDQRGAEPTRGHRNVERGDRVGGGLHQPLEAPYRRDRHAGAKDPPGGTVGDRDDPPTLVVGREHRAAKRVEHDQEPRRIKHGVQNPLDSGLRDIEEIERVGEGAEPQQRQDREHQNDPGRCDGPAQPARMVVVDGAINEPPRKPAQRNGDQRQQNRKARQAKHMEDGGASGEACEPSADERRHHLDVERNFAPNAQPELRIENAGGSREGFAREQFAPLPADPGRVVINLQQHGARGAEPRIECVVLGLLAFELRGRGVGRRRGLLRYGRELCEPLGRSRELRRHVGDRRLQGDAEGVALGAQALQVRIGKIRLLERGVDCVQRGLRRVEVERG